MNVAIIINFNSTEDIRLYLDSAFNTYIAHNQSLLGTHNQNKLASIWISDDFKLRV